VSHVRSVVRLPSGGCQRRPQFCDLTITAVDFDPSDGIEPAYEWEQGTYFVVSAYVPPQRDRKTVRDFPATPLIASLPDAEAVFNPDSSMSADVRAPVAHEFEPSSALVIGSVGR
jgi:hypothetical protein